MSFDDVSLSEMRALRGATPQDIDRLLAGRVPAAGLELDDLTSFFSGLREAFPEPRIEALEAKHLAAMMEAAQQDAASEPATLPTPQRSPSRTSRYISSMKRKVAAASVAGLTAFSGMAVAGVLPPSVQRGVADAARHVGIDLPGATSEDRLRASERQPLERSSEEVAEPEGTDGSDRRDGERGEGSGGDPDRERAGGAAATSHEEAVDETRDREEDAADDARDRQEETADEAGDREEDGADEAQDAEEDAQDAEEEAADEARDREEDAADDAQGTEEEAADRSADDAEDAAEDAAEAEEELESED